MLTEKDNGMVMPVTPMYGNGNSGFGFGGQDGWWLILLFLFAFNGGWGNGGNGGGSMPYVINNDVQRGFDQSAIMGGLNNLSTAVCNGFANAEISRANTNTNTLQALWNMQSQQQACCCDTKSAIADVKYAIATENCNDRQALNEGVRDIITSNTASTQAILDKLCQLELDAKNDKINDLERQLTMANLNASQIQQTSQIQLGQVAEIDALYQRLKDCPVPTMPVYGMQPIFTCNGGNNVGCGCGAF